jgi:osmotically-inducible protein OsmY
MTGKITTFALGATAGAAVAYLLDPDRGGARRARLSDQAKSRARTVSDSLKSGIEYQQGVAKGMVHDLTEILRPPREYDDDTLLQKVRSEALGYWDHPDTIDVDISDGSVRLTGRVESEKGRDRLIELIRAVDGVGLIDDRLDITTTG